MVNIPLYRRWNEAIGEPGRLSVNLAGYRWTWVNHLMTTIQPKIHWQQGVEAQELGKFIFQQTIYIWRFSPPCVWVFSLLVIMPTYLIIIRVNIFLGVFSYCVPKKSCPYQARVKHFCLGCEISRILTYKDMFRTKIYYIIICKQWLQEVYSWKKNWQNDTIKDIV